MNSVESLLFRCRQYVPESLQQEIDETLTKPEKRACRLPKEWRPSGELLTWAAATRPDLCLTQTTEQFCDYWSAKPGQHGLKLDWSATWRNWIRNTAYSPPFAIGRAVRHSQSDRTYPTGKVAQALQALQQLKETSKETRSEQRTGRSGTALAVSIP